MATKVSYKPDVGNFAGGRNDLKLHHGYGGTALYIKLKIRTRKKKELTKSKANRRKEIIKIRAEINGTENRETVKKIRKNNS